jgi:hypothetical protein
MTSTTDMTTESSGTTDVTTSPDSSGTDSGSTGGGDACAPDGADDMCVMCTKDMCCDQLQACADDPDCACVLDCLSQFEMPGIGEAMTCAGPDNCNVDFLSVAIPLMAIDTCRQMSCMDQCG